MYWVGFFVGALIATYLVSRLLMWLTKSWDGGKRKVLTVHAISLMMCGLLGALGGVAEGPFGAVYLVGYAVAQVIWMLMDLRNQQRLAA